MAPNPLDVLAQWFKQRSERAAKIKDATQWVKALGEDRVKAMMEDAHLPEDYFAGTYTYTKEESEFAQQFYLDEVNRRFPNESHERRKELAAWMLYWRLRAWSSATVHERMDRAITRDQERRAAYKADYAQRLDAAAAADPTTIDNRRAHAQQAFQNTGKYLTNTGRELTQDERSQLGLPRSR